MCGRSHYLHAGILKALDDLCVRSNYFAKMGPDFLTDIVYAMAALEHTVSDKFLEVSLFRQAHLDAPNVHAVHAMCAMENSSTEVRLW